MSKTSTSVRVNGAFKSSDKLHVGTFMTEVNLGELAEPIKMYRKPQSNETRKAQPTHRFGYVPPPVDEKNLPLILEDGNHTTTTGVYDEAPGVYMMFVKEGGVMRAYPIDSWFRFGAPKVAESQAAQPVVVKSEGVNQKLIKRLGSLAKAESDPDHSRLRATRESRFTGGTEDGDEVGEEQDYDEDFANDETIVAREDETHDEELVPKKLSKQAKKEQARLKANTGEGDDNDWVYELLYGDSEDEEIGEEDKEEDDGEANGAEPNMKKRAREGEADEGRGDTKRRASSGKQSKVVQDEQYRKDRHSVISTLRTAFTNTSNLTLDASQIIKHLRNAIPNFLVGAAKPGAPKEEIATRDYWSQILKKVLSEYTNSLGGNKFSWKKEQTA